MRKSSPIFLCFFCFLICLSSLTAQKVSKVLGKPTEYIKPIDDAGFIKNNTITKTKSKDLPWIVISDRSENQVFREPGGQVGGKLGFKELFYVVGEKGDWLNIIKTSPSNVYGLKIKEKEGVTNMGWIRREKVLPWTSGLLNKNTKINIKAFLLNKASDIAKLLDTEKKEIVKVFESPNRNNTIETRKIYEFYFILKKETSGGRERYLLSTDAELSSLSLDNQIIGWVDKRRLTEWNTRICLEPNFTETAFEERKNNSKVRVRGFKNPESAKAMAETGTIESTNVMWETDPVLLNKNQLGTGNNKRFLGQVVRFPLIKGIGPVFRSGVISDVKNVKGGKVVSEITAQADSEQNKEVRSKLIAKDNYNVLFVVQGTSNMAQYKPYIINAIKTLPATLGDVSNIKVGVAVYRDINERSLGRDFEMSKLNKNLAKSISFLEETVFSSVNESRYSNMHYGITQALQTSAMSVDHTNIVIVVGMDADVSSNGILRKQHSGDKALIRTAKVGEVLSKYGAHLSVLRCKYEGEEDKAGKAFLRFSKGMISETANKIYGENKYVTEKEGMEELKKNFNNPQFPELEEGNDLYLKDGAKLAQLYRPKGNGEIPKFEVRITINKFVDNVFSFTESFYRMLDDVYSRGQSIGEVMSSMDKVDNVSAGSFTAAFADVLNDFYKSETREIMEEDAIAQIMAENYRLYLEVYFPKKIKGANHSSMSYVLFMPENDLKDYIDQLGRLATAYDQSPDNRRDALFETMLTLVEKFSGEDLDKKRMKGMDIKEVVDVLQGVKGEGVEYDLMQNFRIGDILDEKKMSDEDVQKFMTRIINNRAKLKKMIIDSKYEFSYRSESRAIYYWVPIEYTF